VPRRRRGPIVVRRLFPRAGDPVVVLITRPGEPGRQLATRLHALGQAALWWPAFDLSPPVDPQRVRDCITHLGGFDLVVFVSPMAVNAFAGALAGAPWPDTTRVAGVGSATVRALVDALGLGDGGSIIGPAGKETADGGAEALWPALAALQPAPRRVLIVRAQAGRDWLGGQLRAGGAEVKELEAYRRDTHEPTPQEWDRLSGALGPGTARALAVLFSSTEAVGVLTPALAAAGLGPQRAGAVALCVHERIAEAAAAAGWPDVRRCEPRAEAIVGALAGPAGVADDPAGPLYKSAGPRPDSVA